MTTTTTHLIRLARMRLINERPYLGTLLARMVLVEKDQPEKRTGSPIWVDHRWICYYHEASCRQHFSRDGMAFVLYHELLHLIREHPRRAQSLEPDRGNIAADLEINDDLFVELHKWAPHVDGAFAGMLPEQYGLPDGRVLEWYYERLPKDGGEGGGEKTVMAGACGSCATGQGQEGEDGQTSDGETVQGVGDLEAKALLKNFAEELTSGRAAGSIPGHLSHWAKGHLEPPKIDWRKQLQSKALRLVARQAGRVDYTYARPSRRDDDTFIFPGMYAPKVNVAVVQDTSASMSKGDIRSSLQETRGIFSRAGVDTIRFLAVDAAVHCDVETRNIEQVKARLTGGGGTDMTRGLRHLKKTGRRPSVVVVFTDGETPWPTKKPPFETIVCLVGQYRQNTAPDWAHVVEVD